MKLSERKLSLIGMVASWVAAILLGILAVEDRWSLPMPKALALSGESMARVWVQIALMAVVLVFGAKIVIRSIVSLVQGKPNGSAFCSVGVLAALVYSIIEVAKCSSEPARMTLIQFEWAAWPLAMLITFEFLGLDREAVSTKERSLSKELGKQKRLYELIFGALVLVVVAICLLCGMKKIFVLRVLVGMLTTASMGMWGLFQLLMSSAFREAERYGIRVRDEEAMKLLSETNRVILDKTGTLTHGQPKVVSLIPMGKATRLDVITLAATAESGNKHPYAQAILDAYITASAGIKPIPQSVPEELIYRSGLGVRLTVQGDEVQVGNARWMRQAEIDIDFDSRLTEQMIESGQTLIYVAKNKKLYGILGISDQLVPQAKKSVEEIKSLGIKVRMLTGDDQRVADLIGRQTGVDEATGLVLPEEKVELVQEAVNGGETVLFAGLLSNTTPAILAANVGFAIGELPESLEREAEVTTEHGNITQLRHALSIAHRTWAKIIMLRMVTIGFQAVAFLLSCGLLYALFGRIVSPMQITLFTLAFRLWVGYYLSSR